MTRTRNKNAHTEISQESTIRRRLTCDDNRNKYTLYANTVPVDACAMFRRLVWTHPDLEKSLLDLNKVLSAFLQTSRRPRRGGLVSESSVF